MIDRKKAIEELNSKICFISQKYADSDRSVKDILENAEEDFMATEGEIAILLEYNPLAQIRDELSDLYGNLYSQRAMLNLYGDLHNQRAKLEGKIEMIETIYRQIQKLDDDCDDSPAEINNNSPAVTSRSQIAEAEKYLAAYITDNDEVQHVLQEIVYMLFNAELYSNETDSIHCNIEPMERKD